MRRIVVLFLIVLGFALMLLQQRHFFHSGKPPLVKVNPWQPDPVAPVWPDPPKPEAKSPPEPVPTQPEPPSVEAAPDPVPIQSPLPGGPPVTVPTPVARPADSSSPAKVRQPVRRSPKAVRPHQGRSRPAAYPAQKAAGQPIFIPAPDVDDGRMEVPPPLFWCPC